MRGRRRALLTAFAAWGVHANAVASIVDTSGVVRAGDFDNDGHNELVVSSPETNCGKGAVYVISHEGDLTTWTRDSSGVLGTAECGDLFGASLAVGDFDGDGYDDLAIAAPGADDTENTASGSVHILYGSETGLSDAGDQLWTLDSPGVDGTAAADDHWGDALAVGDFNCDGYDDLAIGAPRKQALQTLVSILYGTSGGMSSVGDQLLSREGGFGAALTAGNFDGDQDNDLDCDDLIVAAPYAQGSAGVNEGAIFRYAGSASGIDTDPTQTIHQDVTGVVDTAEIGDFFGWRLATVDVDHNAYDDLFVTVPGDACSGSVGSGRHTFFGSSSGLAIAGNAIDCDSYGCSLLSNGTFECHSGSAPVYGWATSDVITTGASTGIVWGGAGSDAIYGRDGNDILFGGDGDDFIVPGAGRDVVIAGNGDDTIVIDLDCMVLEGEVVDGGPGNDTIKSHRTQTQLETLGLTIVSVENFVTIEEDALQVGSCDPAPNDDGPVLRPRVSLSWPSLSTPDSVTTTSTGIVSLHLHNSSASSVTLDLEFVLRVRGHKIVLRHAPFAISANTSDTHTLDLNDFIPSWITPPSSSPLYVLPTSASISTSAKLTSNSRHVGYSYAPTLYGHLESISATDVAVLYREGALHSTYFDGDLAQWRHGALTYTGDAKIVRHIEVLGSL